MKPFRFSLQAVLTVRLNQENKALEAFAFAQAEFEKISARFQKVQAEIEDVFARRRASFKTTANSLEIQQLLQGLRALQDASRKIQAELQNAKTIVEEKSRTLVGARQQREVVEKVQEKQLAIHRLQTARDEQKVLDELATLKSMGNLALKWR